MSAHTILLEACAPYSVGVCAPALQWFVNYQYNLVFGGNFSLHLPKTTLFNKVNMSKLRLNFFYATLN